MNGVTTSRYEQIERLQLCLRNCSPTMQETVRQKLRMEHERVQLHQGQQGPQVTLSDLKIRTKDKRLITLVPNETQALYGDMLAADYPGFDWRAGHYTLRGIREDVLKSRQQGMSTWWLALFFLDTINTPLTQSVILTDNGDRSETLFRIIHRFYEHLPAHLKRPKKYSTRREIEFSDIDSLIAVGTAGTSNVGRGGTVNNCLLSERSFMVNGEEVESGLLESVPLESGNVVRETTANGFNEYYHERQREHRGESRFVPRFFGWNLHSEYRIAVPQDFTRTPEEAEIAALHGLDDGQLAWARVKRTDLKSRFPQEYPLTEGEAFLSSGNPYFDRPSLLRLLAELEKPDYDPLGRLVFEAENYPLLRGLYRDHELRVYSLPEDDHDYVIAADPSKGLGKEGDHDYSAAHVLDVQTYEQVAVVHGYYHPARFGQILNELAWYYNEALVGVHRLAQGEAVLSELQYHVEQPDGSLGYPVQLGEACTGIYTFDHSHIKGLKVPQRPVTRQTGFPETERSKIYMLDTLQRLLEEDPGLLIYDRATVGELLSFVQLPGGGAGAESGCHDDLVSAIALGAVLLTLRYRRDSRRSRPREPQVPRTSSTGKVRR